MTRTLIAGLVALMSTASVSAQEPAIRLTLEEAVARGLEHSHRLAELGAREEAAKAAETGRQAARLPIVAALGGYTRTNHVDEFVIAQPGQPRSILYPDVPDNYRTRLDLQWPIYTAGRNDALERAAAAERAAAGADVDAARSDLRFEIARAFWGLVTARETEVVLARSLDSLDAHVRDLRSRLDQGLIPPNDVLASEVQQSRQRLFAIEARNARAIAEADLCRLIGVDPAGRIDPAASLDAPVAPIAAVDALVAQALTNRPERRGLEDRVSASRAREAALGAATRPQITVDAGYDYARPNPHIFPREDRWRDSWDVSVNGRWLLWDGGRSRADRAEAAAVTRAADARVDEFASQVAFEVRQRWLEADSSRAAIAVAGDGVRSATENRRVVTERFNAGVATSTDVLDAEVALLQAALDRTRAIANARLADARLARAVGSP